MERAGLGVAIAATELGTVYGARVSVLAGKGNNGGDGYVAARYLAGRGCAVTVHALAPAVGPASNAAQRALAAGVRIVEIGDPTAADVVVDGLFGSGFRGELPDAVLPWTRHGAPVVAIECAFRTRRCHRPGVARLLYSAANGHIPCPQAGACPRRGARTLREGRCHRYRHRGRHAGVAGMRGHGRAPAGACPHDPQVGSRIRCRHRRISGADRRASAGGNCCSRHGGGCRGPGLSPCPPAHVRRRLSSDHDPGSRRRASFHRQRCRGSRRGGRPIRCRRSRAGPRRRPAGLRDALHLGVGGPSRRRRGRPQRTGGSGPSGRPCRPNGDHPSRRRVQTSYR